MQAGYQLDKAPLVSTIINIMSTRLQLIYSLLLLYYIGGLEGYWINKMGNTEGLGHFLTSDEAEINSILPAFTHLMLSETLTALILTLATPVVSLLTY